MPVRTNPQRFTCFLEGAFVVFGEHAVIHKQAFMADGLVMRSRQARQIFGGLPELLHLVRAEGKARLVRQGFGRVGAKIFGLGEVRTRLIELVQDEKNFSARLIGRNEFGIEADRLRQCRQRLLARFLVVLVEVDIAEAIVGLGVLRLQCQSRPSVREGICKVIMIGEEASTKYQRRHILWMILQQLVDVGEGTFGIPEAEKGTRTAQESRRAGGVLFEHLIGKIQGGLPISLLDAFLNLLQERLVTLSERGKAENQRDERATYSEHGQTPFRERICEMDMDGSMPRQTVAMTACDEADAPTIGLTEPRLGITLS